MPQAIDPNTIYDSFEVARLVHGRSLAWFYTYRSKPKGGRSLADKEGFPKPTSGRGHPRWLGSALIAWLARPKLDAALEASEGTNLVDIRARLRQRSRAMAVGRLARRG